MRYHHAIGLILILIFTANCGGKVVNPVPAPLNNPQEISLSDSVGTTETEQPQVLEHDSTTDVCESEKRPDLSDAFSDIPTDSITDSNSDYDGGSDKDNFLEYEVEEVDSVITNRKVPCIHSFDELIEVLPPAKIAAIKDYFLEDIAFTHSHVKNQFTSYYGGCKTQTKLHQAIDRGEQIYFPIIDKEAAEHFPEAIVAGEDETPLIDVLKALTVVESMVNTNAISWAGAGGPWQFMRSTFARIAKRIGMEDPYPAEDLRFDWASASRAGFELTKENLRAFQWTKSPVSCAIMAYNGGIVRVSHSLRKQQRLDCRQLKYTNYSNKAYIATETYLYQPRIIMVLLVMNWRRVNGYNLVPSDAYHPTVLKGAGAIRLQTLGEKAGIDYKELIKTNRRYPLGVTPTGEWELEVNPDHLDLLAAALPQVERISDERITAMLEKAAPLDIVKLLGDGAFRYYKVRSGDNVSTICKRFGVSRARLYQLNKQLFIQNKKRSHGHDWMLYVGQRLRLPGLDQLIIP